MIASKVRCNDNGELLQSSFYVDITPVDSPSDVASSPTSSQHASSSDLPSPADSHYAPSTAIPDVDLTFREYCVLLPDADHPDSSPGVSAVELGVSNAIEPAMRLREAESSDTSSASDVVGLAFGL